MNRLEQQVATANTELAQLRKELEDHVKYTARLTLELSKAGIPIPPKDF